MPNSGEKLAKSEATRRRLIECAVQELAVSGADRIGFTAIAKRSGMSTGALYARYENAEELLIDVWHTRCVPALAQLVRDLLAMASDDPPEQKRRSVIDVVNTLDADIVAAIGIMVVARRDEALREEVDPSVSRVVGEGAMECPVLPHALAHILGLILLIRGTGHVGQDWSKVITHIAGAAWESWCRAAAGETTGDGEQVVPDMDRLVPSGLDELEARLYEAVCHVVERVGVDHATVSRIARTAGVNPATIYLRFDDKEALVSRCMRIVCDAASVRNERLVADFMAGRNIVAFSEVVFRANASDGYAHERILRLESLYAAGHQDTLRRTHREVYDETGEAYARIAGSKGFDISSTTWKFVFLNWATFFGHALLRPYGFLSSDDRHIGMMAEAMTRAITRSRPIPQDL